VGRRRDLDQIEIALLRGAERVLHRHHAELCAVGIDHTHLAGTDLAVHAGLVLDFRYATPPGMRACCTVRATKSASDSVSAGPAVRGATVPAAASRSPTTAMTGIFSSCASRTL